MCTVTFLPGKNKGEFILTSNRDERAVRETIPPEIYTVNARSLCFPKDKKAGGSWIASNNSGRLCCLLNGGVKPHTKQSKHTQSRGQVLIEAASAKDSVQHYFKHKNLKNVEPFTLVVIEHEENTLLLINEFVWDGTNKHFKVLNKNKSYIWSSATLYNEQQRELRKQWFADFLNNSASGLTAEKAFQFHAGNHTNDESVDLVMQRNELLKTVSITQVIPQNGKTYMKYFDLQKQQYFECVN